MPNTVYENTTEMSGFRSSDEGEEKKLECSHSANSLEATGYRRPTLEDWLEVPIGLQSAIKEFGYVEGKKKLQTIYPVKNLTATGIRPPTLETPRISAPCNSKPIQGASKKFSLQSKRVEGKKKIESTHSDQSSEARGFTRPTFETPCARTSCNSKPNQKGTKYGFRSVSAEEKEKLESGNFLDKKLAESNSTRPTIEDWLRVPRLKKRNRKIRCFNCGEFAEHIAANCSLAPRPRRCHLCQSDDHFMADCPSNTTKAEAGDVNNNMNSATDITDMRRLTTAVKNCTMKSKR